MGLLVGKSVIPEHGKGTSIALSTAFLLLYYCFTTAFRRPNPVFATGVQGLSGLKN
ncbi:hypothetical protein [Corynebacterium glutamicum]|uniref:hypothetical protein n=1 Tax=Corynebacterium glutamicum TaxID=1718 RepID=UPI000AA3BF2C|nr:hypothetical protein [Corynebacterium glutamicum]